MPVQAGAIDMALNWPGFLKPALTSIEVQDPIVRGAVANGKFALYGLETVIRAQMARGQEADTGNGAKTTIKIEGGQLVLATDAGEVSGTFALDGTPMMDGTAWVHINPNMLKRGEAEIEWSKGNIDLVFKDGAIIGEIDFAIARARLNGLGLSNGLFSGKLAEDQDQIAFELTGRADSLFASGAQAERVHLKVNGGLTRLERFDMAALLKALGVMTLSAEGENISTGELHVERADIGLDMQKTPSGLSGPVVIDIAGLEAGQGGAGQLVATGEMAIALGDTSGDSAAYRYKGALVLRDASLGAQERTALLGAITLPDPLAGHGTQLRAALSQALERFDTGLELDATYRGQNWSLAASRPTLLQASSGLMFSIDPFANQPWLRADQEQIDIAGEFSLGGGQGTPSLSGALDRLHYQAANTSLMIRAVKLAPWQAGGRTLSARIESLEVDLGARIRMDANGEVSLYGAMPGLDLKPTRLVGHVSAIEAVEGWRVQTHKNSCVGFFSDGMASGALAFTGMTLSLCPVDGRFVRQENGKSVGRIDMGDLSLPFKTLDASGIFGIRKAGLEWFAGDGFRLFVKGDDFSLPLQFTGDTFLIDGVSPEVSFALVGGPAQIRAVLGQTRFGGTMVPAQVVASTFSFNGVTAQAGVDGVMQAGHVRISDLRDDPVYQPLIADLSATMRDGVVALTGPIRNEARGLVIANADMNLHLADFTGKAHVRMEALNFARGGLQPVHLSELLRGVLTNANGSMSGQADFVIDRGALAGTGYVDLTDLVLDTFSAGQVSGVNGHIVFSDILALTTAPSQKLDIGFMDPGVPLNNGEIYFQIIEGATTKIEQASWPFAGGRLVVLPTTFIAGAEAERITMQARELELEQLIEVFGVPDLYATGTVSGEFPIDIEGANIMIRDAVLQADEKGGKLAYTGTATDLVKGQNEYSDFALQALRDLDYTVMRIGASGNLIGQIVLTADLLGKSDDVLGGAQFNFKLSLDSPLAQILRSLNEASNKTYIKEFNELKKAEQTEDQQ